MYTIRQTQTHQLAWAQIHGIYRDRDTQTSWHENFQRMLDDTKWKLDSYTVYVLLLVRPFMQILHLNHLEIKYNTSYDKIAIHSISYSNTSYKLPYIL